FKTVKKLKTFKSFKTFKTFKTLSESVFDLNDFSGAVAIERSAAVERCERAPKFKTFKRFKAPWFVPALSLAGNSQRPHRCHPERSEGSGVFSRISRRDSSAWPRND